LRTQSEDLRSKRAEANLQLTHIIQSLVLDESF
jgi:hypothetical protein